MMILVHQNNDYIRILLIMKPLILLGVHCVFLQAADSVLQHGISE